MNFDSLKQLYLVYYGKCSTCKGCVFYTGVQCHGHGDYWGTCLLAYEIHKYCEDNISNYNLSYYKCTVYDDSKCVLSAYYDYIIGGD